MIVYKAKLHLHTQNNLLHSHLHSLDDIIDVPQEVLSQHQSQSRLTLHRLVHIDVHIHRTVGLKHVR